MRVLVFASSSPETPPNFLKTATELGELLAKEGHVCVNGGGNIGGMGALNTACTENGGKIVTVIHKRWVLDGEEFESETGESIVVEGPDLAERKRKLIEGASCIVALPGGFGTLDELFDATCLKQLGFIEDLPICLVNVDGYWDPVLSQLGAGKRANLIRKGASDLIHAEPTARKALDFCASKVALSRPAQPETNLAQTKSARSTFKLVKALAMLPVILLCYTWLFFKTVNLLMQLGGEVSDSGSGTTTLPWYVEFFGLIGVLLFACKNLK